ncbi:MAG: hypothetical protein LBF44_02060, partial [Holosporaceae bacterium]|nr:hypothetical protein [Holosporaceae bacterium]
DRRDDEDGEKDEESSRGKVASRGLTKGGRLDKEVVEETIEYLRNLGVIDESKLDGLVFGDTIHGICLLCRKVGLVHKIGGLFEFGICSSCVRQKQRQIEEGNVNETGESQSKGDKGGSRTGGDGGSGGRSGHDSRDRDDDYSGGSGRNRRDKSERSKEGEGGLFDTLQKGIGGALGGLFNNKSDSTVSMAPSPVPVVVAPAAPAPVTPNAVQPTNQNSQMGQTVPANQAAPGGSIVDTAAGFAKSVLPDKAAKGIDIASKVANIGLSLASSLPTGLFSSTPKTSASTNASAANSTATSQTQASANQASAAAGAAAAGAASNGLSDEAAQAQNNASQLKVKLDLQKQELEEEQQRVNGGTLTGKNLKKAQLKIEELQKEVTSLQEEYNKATAEANKQQ